jgi:hypothetical protein
MLVPLRRELLRERLLLLSEVPLLDVRGVDQTKRVLVLARGIRPVVELPRDDEQR